MLTSPLHLLARLPGPVRLLVVGTLVNKLGTFIMPYLTLVLQRQFHLRPGQIGVLVAAHGLGSMVAILAGGFLTDRLGRRLTLMMSLFGSGALAVAMGLVWSVTAFVPLLLLFAFLADLYRPAASAIIADVLPSAQRAIGFAGLRAAVNLGFSAGVVLGGVLADWSWRSLFLGDGLTTILYGFIVHRFIGETRPGGLVEQAASSAGRLRPWRDGVYLQLTLASFAFCLVLFSFSTVLPLTVTVSARYPARVYGAILAANGLAIGLFEMSVVGWLRRFRRLRVAAVGLVVTGTGFALTGAVLHWTWFLLSVLIWTGGEILSGPQMTAFVADWSPPAARGRYLSVYQATWSLAAMANPLILLPLHARLSEATFWPLLSLITMPAALLLVKLDGAADQPHRLRGVTAEALAAVEAQARAT